MDSLAARGRNTPAAIRALSIANEYLSAEVERLRATNGVGYVRGSSPKPVLNSNARQSFVFRLWDAVKSIGYPNQAFAVMNDDASALRWYQTAALKRMESDRNAWPMHTEHQRQEIMLQWKFITIVAVMRLQQRACQAFFQTPASVDKSSVRRLEGARISLVRAGLSFWPRSGKLGSGPPRSRGS